VAATARSIQGPTLRRALAVCTLNDEALTEAVARTRPPEVSIVGTLHTENLGR
jgi:hypothetical protein